MDLSKCGLYRNFLAKVGSPTACFGSKLLLLLCSDQAGERPPREEGVADNGGETGGDSDPGGISNPSVNPRPRGRTSKKGFSIEKLCPAALKLCDAEFWETARARAAASWWK